MKEQWKKEVMGWFQKSGQGRYGKNVRKPVGKVNRGLINLNSGERLAMMHLLGVIIVLLGINLFLPVVRPLFNEEMRFHRLDSLIALQQGSDSPTRSLDAYGKPPQTGKTFGNDSEGTSRMGVGGTSGTGFGGNSGTGKTFGNVSEGTNGTGNYFGNVSEGTNGTRFGGYSGRGNSFEKKTGGNSGTRFGGNSGTGKTFGNVSEGTNGTGNSFGNVSERTKGTRFGGYSGRGNSFEKKTGGNSGTRFEGNSGTGKTFEKTSGSSSGKGNSFEKASGGSAGSGPSVKSNWSAPIPVPVLELNEADSTELVALPQIGEVMASRIQRYRERLGGFVSMEQLFEVKGMDSARYATVRPYLTLEPQVTRAIDVNRDDFKTLLRHPYLDYDQVKAIFNQRERRGLIHDWEQLKGLLGDVNPLLEPYVRY